MRFFKVSFVGIILIILFSCSESSQQADPNFTPQNTRKTFSNKNSPVVFIDEAHNNFLTVNGRYRPFVQVLESDGYTVRPNKSRFSSGSLHSADILVIANALDKNRKDWSPPFTDALTNEEVSSVTEWVLEGGSLFLVADHTPFPKIIENLAGKFGFEFSNGHVGNAVFRANDKTLGKHTITSRAGQAEQNFYLPTALTEMTKSTIKPNRIEQVVTFGGSAFKAPPEATSLLTLGEGAFSIVPDVPFQVNADTPRLPMHGWSQGAVLEVGKGRVAVFAEGMMFSSQLDAKTGKTLGLASKGAEQNEIFLLNVMGWLAGAI
ncbi:DUF4350 domain-containing protein [Thalassomonas haliotis]|uniref:DUF4350 domain-containing protein n=1 Tax=Thalassomonas haliotis TaxID=485448 RepID=A0ABY7VA28_9GAMM|nr:DUF4350 domain-containing protein [Thalassomonas haliotis]WDE10396.1 DUF4350 domain-containing protein [Thalassomonas haliotis]